MYKKTGTCWLYMNVHNPKGSNILLLIVHVSCKIVDFVHQCAYTDIMFYYGSPYQGEVFVFVRFLPLAAASLPRIAAASHALIYLQNHFFNSFGFNILDTSINS